MTQFCMNVAWLPRNTTPSWSEPPSLLGAASMHRILPHPPKDDKKTLKNKHICTLTARRQRPCSSAGTPPPLRRARSASSWMPQRCRRHFVLLSCVATLTTPSLCAAIAWSHRRYRCCFYCCCCCYPPPRSRQPWSRPRSCYAASGPAARVRQTGPPPPPPPRVFAFPRRAPAAPLAAVFS